ncbi:hypothetical protein [Catellatospora sp. IY07-71]|uniref:hypothetical protein n=1 Tax=Catellatospora sp. IY07-71 TaxID=2728827 RepID=UPI001BB38D05|nr:hypothetical protein [Catellatospora sp. IY07-71]
MRDDLLLNVILDSLISCVALLDEHIADEVLDGRIALKQLESISYEHRGDARQLRLGRRRRLTGALPRSPATAV